MSLPIHLLRGISGALAGGVLAFFAFGWLVGQGLYALGLTGVMIGVGCRLASGTRSLALGVICAVGGLALGILCEWHNFPFIEDGSLAYFLGHLHQLRPITLIMIGLSGLFAYLLGQGSEDGKLA